MAQFDVHRNKGALRDAIPFVVIVQSAQFDGYRRRVVVPLVRDTLLPRNTPTIGATVVRNSHALSGAAGLEPCSVLPVFGLSVNVCCTNLKHPYLCTRCLASAVPSACGCFGCSLQGWGD
jgi:hypothetical protein